MPISTRNALHVLHLVWRKPIGQRKIASVTQLEALTDLGSSEWFSSSEQSGLAEDEHIGQTSNFLESQSKDYHRISSSLSPVKITPINIPWPSLFPPSPVVTRVSSHKCRGIIDRFGDPKHLPDLPLSIPKPCDPIARLALSGDLDSAREVYEELRQLKVRVQHRLIYLPAAVSCLEKGDKDGFIFWLELYPNRPPAKGFRRLGKTWFPIINRLLRQYSHDTHFIIDFTYLTARKGILPLAMTLLIRHLTHVLPPEDSLRVFAKALDLYGSATIPTGSETERGLFLASVVADLTKAWWNEYLRALVSSGCLKEALVLYEGYHTAWDEHTVRMIRARGGLTSKEMSQHPETPCVEDEDAQAVLASSLPKDTEIISLATQVRSALKENINSATLAKLITALKQCSYDHPTLLCRFQHRFYHPPKRRSGHHTILHRESIWWHAIMLNHREASDDRAVIKVFQEHYLWLGLPPIHSTSYRQSEAEALIPLYPNIYIIASLLPAILNTLPRPFQNTLPGYHAVYLDQCASLPPALQPNNVIHKIMVSCIVEKLGSTAALSAIWNIVAAGLNPGEEACSLVLRRLARENKMGQMYDLLELMEDEGQYVLGVGRLPRPRRHTYTSLARYLTIEKRRPEEATKVLGIARRRNENISVATSLEGLGNLGEFAVVNGS